MFERYAIYYTFEGPLAEQGAAWLGWDIAKGVSVEHAKLASVDLVKITARPRAYGFHATIKAPFYLNTQTTQRDLEDTFASLCKELSPVCIDALSLTLISRFLAFTIAGDDQGMALLAKQVVKQLDGFRAPLTEQERARRRPERLNAQQRANLERWGYPSVMEDFQFHVTLTGNIKDRDLESVTNQAKSFFQPLLTAPFTLAHLTLVGQRSDASFREIIRLPLTG